MVDKWVRFRGTAQTSWMGMPSAVDAHAAHPTQIAISEFETSHRAGHGLPTAATPQTTDDDQAPLTSATGIATPDDGSTASISTDTALFKIHTTATPHQDPAATSITAEADLQIAASPDHAAARPPVAAENALVGIAQHAQWHAEITDTNVPAASASVAPVVGNAARVQATAAPDVIDTHLPASDAAETAISLASPDTGDHVAASYPAGWTGVPANQVLAAIGGSGASVTGAGIKVGVLSDSFNDLGGAAADEANGALPSAANIQILEDLASGGTDEGRAMMQIVHHIAPSASLAFYTAFNSEQDFANGILALAAAGCKVICDDVSYYDEPFFQNGIVAQAIQTVEAEGVTYIAAAGNNGSAAYQSAWTPMSGSYDGVTLTDALSFGGSIVQTINVMAGVPLLLEWSEAYGQATSDLELLIFHNGSLIATATNQSLGEPTNPWTAYQFSTSGSYQIAIENLSGPDPGVIKEIAAGNGLPVTISGANAGTVFGHAMTPGVIAAGAVDSAVTPAFGYGTFANESYSSSGAGTELFFANDGTPLSSPLTLNPVVVSGIDDIATTVSGGLHDFYGTSAASASLAGVAALILAANPNLTPAQVAQIMEETALPLSNPAVAGAGLVQVNAAISAALQFGGTVIESFGSTSLVQGGTHYFVDNVSTGTGPELKYGGTPVTAGEFGTIAPVGAAQTASGYDVAWQIPGTNQFTFWTTDGNGNYTSNISGLVSGSSFTSESLETTFGQDFNHDGTVGVTASLIQTSGSTSLLQIADNYYAYVAGSGPSLKYGGSPVTVGEFGTIAPVAAMQTGSGYEVVWEIPGTNQFTFWATDANGNYTSNLSGLVSGGSLMVEFAEATFGHDFNGDGTVGVTASLVQTDVSTSLLHIADTYYIYVNGNGPQLKYAGTGVTDGEFGTITPIGAIQTASGYDVAWKIPGTSQFTFWTTDSNGNYTSNITGLVDGTSNAVETLETTFHQDLNGDGVIGVPSPASASTVVASAGLTAQSATHEGAPDFSGNTSTVTTLSTFKSQIVGLGNASGDPINLGNNAQAGFHFSEAADAGLLLTSPAGPAQPTITTNLAGVLAGHETFVFAPTFGKIGLASFGPAADGGAFSRSVFADQPAPGAATHDDASGNAVVADAAHDAITSPHVIIAQLVTHMTDFHLV